MNNNLSSRLYNWKFNQALRYLDGETEEVKNLVNALAMIFGNIGWELDSPMVVIIGFAVDSVIYDKNGELIWDKEKEEQYEIK